MHRLATRLALFLWTLSTGTAPAADGAPVLATRPEPLRFFAVGDLPYSPSEMEPLRALLADGAAGGSPFLVHLGDIKSGSTPCTDDQLREIAGLFRAQPVPVVYSIGDNEWTDCGRKAAGGLDPRGRLKRVREIFFGDPSVLRLGALDPIQAGKTFPEIYAFARHGVLVVVLHVVGSNNGLDRSDTVATAELAGRDRENRRFLERALASPQGRTARALVLAIQANPLFENAAGPAGYRGFKDRLVALMRRFQGPVLVLHGDTHRFRMDRPLVDPVRGIPFERLVRVEVPGSPSVGGVWITVDPDAQEPIVADPVYAVSLDRLGQRSGPGSSSSAR
jgi:hypothetical protein